MKIICVLLLLAPTLSWASSPQNSKPCSEDLKKFCKDLDKKEAKKCLKAHLKEISPACKKHLDEVKASNLAKKDALKKEDQVSEECKNIKPTEAKFKECAKERYEIAKNKFRSYHDKLKANKKARLDKEKAEKEKLEKEQKEKQNI